MKILGLETSCDDTSAAILCDSPDPSVRILSNIVSTQINEHAPYGGVVPEIASRAHINNIIPVVKQALDKAQTSLNELDAIAAVVLGGTSLMGGRGRLTGTLIGALIIGVLNNALNIMEVSSYYQLVAKGAVILLAVVVDSRVKARGA